VYGGPPFGWNETINQGAFKRTLRNGADVAFLINHEGMTLARTKSGTLDLTEDKTGLRTVARLDARMNIVNDLQIAVERGDVDEMSFAFRVVKDEWFDQNGDPSNDMVGTERRISEINMDHGDVSAVNYGANPATSGGFRYRNIDAALAELRSGTLRDEYRELIADFAKLLMDPLRDKQPADGEGAWKPFNPRSMVINPSDIAPHSFVQAADGGNCAICGQLEADHTGDLNPQVGGTTQTDAPVQASAEELDTLKRLRDFMRVREAVEAP
jgi:HK97 family phage prohead protease